MSTIHHLSLDIEGALLRKDFGGFQHPDGRPMSRREAETALKYELAMGKKLMPVGKCDGFDPQTGCPGHVECPECGGLHAAAQCDNMG